MLSQKRDHMSQFQSSADDTQLSATVHYRFPTLQNATGSIAVTFHLSCGGQHMSSNKTVFVLLVTDKCTLCREASGAPGSRADECSLGHRRPRRCITLRCVFTGCRHWRTNTCRGVRFRCRARMQWFWRIEYRWICANLYQQIHYQQTSIGLVMFE